MFTASPHFKTLPHTLDIWIHLTKENESDMIRIFHMNIDHEVKGTIRIMNTGL